MAPTMLASTSETSHETGEGPRPPGRSGDVVGSGEGVTSGSDEGASSGCGSGVGSVIGAGV
jgi:hypothetical protein